MSDHEGKQMYRCIIDEEAVDAVETQLFLAGCEPEDSEMRRRFAHAVVLHLCDEGYEIVKNPNARHTMVPI